MLHNAARQGDVEAVKRFANEANVNLKDDSGVNIYVLLTRYLTYVGGYIHC